MNLFTILAGGIFVLGYLLITLEHKLGTHKSAIALALAGILWLLVVFSGVDPHTITHHLEEAGTEIFGIVAFLLAAMALVEILIHYRFFDLIQVRLSKFGLSDKGQFFVIVFMTFFLSAILDNLTVTIVMIQIARRFFTEKNLLVTAAGIVILANAGGAWSPIGDVTTIMLWLAHKFSAFQVITEAFIPAAALGVASAVLLGRQITTTTRKKEKMSIAKLSTGERSVISLALLSFSLPLAMNLIGLQPYIGLLLGLGLVWMLIEFVKRRSNVESHMSANIETLLQKTDISSIKFFIGILLSVAALQALGVLEVLSHVLLGQNPEMTRIIAGNTVLGLLSAVVDNVPLTALAIDVIPVQDPTVWVMLALAVGTGGSFLIIGSVAGVIAMGMVKDLTFGKYLKIASIPAIVGYFVGISVWLAQYYLFLRH